MANLAAVRAAVFFALCEKPGGRITAPPGRARDIRFILSAALTQLISFIDELKKNMIEIRCHALI